MSLSSPSEAQIRHEYSDSTPAEAVIQAVAALTDENPTELTPLYEAIDPDALNALFSGVNALAHGSVVEFTYEGYRVEVRADGVVTARLNED